MKTENRSLTEADESEPVSDGGRSPRWVTDGGLETDLIFHHDVVLDEFAAYPLLDSATGRALLTDYYTGYAHVARAAGANLLLETPTWRANPDWVRRLGGSPDDLRRVNIESVAFLSELAEGFDLPGKVRVSGMIGPRGDGYVPGESASAEEFADYHSAQIAAFAEGGASHVGAYTLTTVAEAVGVVRAAHADAMHAAVAFTVETDGRLPDGTSLASAAADLWAQAQPDHLLINCAHPSHIAQALSDDSWTSRVSGLRVNASSRSHAELDAAETIDEGDIGELVAAHEQLAQHLPNLDIVGGCCGTDVRHVAALWGVEAPARRS